MPMLPTPCSLLHAPYSLLHAPCSMLPTPYSLLPAPCSMLHAPCSLLPAPCSMLPTPRIPRGAPLKHVCPRQPAKPVKPHVLVCSSRAHVAVWPQGPSVCSHKSTRPLPTSARFRRRSSLITRGARPPTPPTPPLPQPAVVCSCSSHTRSSSGRRRGWLRAPPPYAPAGSASFPVWTSSRLYVACPPHHTSLGATCHALLTTLLPLVPRAACPPHHTSLGATCQVLLDKGSHGGVGSSSLQAARAAVHDATERVLASAPAVPSATAQVYAMLRKADRPLQPWANVQRLAWTEIGMGGPFAGAEEDEYAHLPRSPPSFSPASPKISQDLPADCCPPTLFSSVASLCTGTPSSVRCVLSSARGPSCAPRQSPLASPSSPSRYGLSPIRSGSFGKCQPSRWPHRATRRHPVSARLRAGTSRSRALPISRHAPRGQARAAPSTAARRTRAAAATAAVGTAHEVPSRMTASPGGFVSARRRAVRWDGIQVRRISPHLPTSPRIAPHPPTSPTSPLPPVVPPPQSTTRRTSSTLRSRAGRTTMPTMPTTTRRYGEIWGPPIRAHAMRCTRSTTRARRDSHEISPRRTWRTPPRAST